MSKINFRMSIDEKHLEFLTKLSKEKTKIFGKKVSRSAVIRSMINKEMDEYKPRKKIWDED